MKDQKAARKLLVKQVPFSRTTVEKILKEKFTHGDVIDGACPRSRLRRFDKLSIEQKEDIRKLVLSVCKSRCGNYGNSLTQIFSKNFVKIVVLLNQLLKS